MTTHLIYLFATTANPKPPYISQDGGATWSNSDDADFTTDVDAGDTVQWRYDLNMKDENGNEIPNKISAITSIAPATFFDPIPTNRNSFTGTIKTGNPSRGVQSYTIRYNVTGAGPQSQDPKIQMKT